MMKLSTMLLLTSPVVAYNFGISLPATKRPAVAPTAVRHAPTMATLVTKPASAARPLLVPALSYGGLAAVAVGTSKVVAMAGYGGAMIMGVSLPVASAAAVAAPALWMFVEYRLLGGGERVAKMMGGMPADERLTELASDVARRAGLKPPAHVFEIPTDELNAFAAGFGTADATVAVTSGLRRALTTTELEAVLAHEIGHIRHSDMRTSMHVAVAIAGLGGIYEIGRVLARSEPSSRSDDDDDDSGSVAALGWGLMAGGVAARCAAHMLQLSMSRSAEYDADSVAAELCGSEAMISALRKIQRVADEKEKRRGSGWWPKGKAAEEPALASFRGGAFSHSYISNGEASDALTKKGKGDWWQGVKTALSTHPTTDSRIAALEKELVRPPHLR